MTSNCTDSHSTKENNFISASKINIIIGAIETMTVTNRDKTTQPRVINVKSVLFKQKTFRVKE